MRQYYTQFLAHWWTDRKRLDFDWSCENKSEEKKKERECARALFVFEGRSCVLRSARLFSLSLSLHFTLFLFYILVFY